MYLKFKGSKDLEHPMFHGDRKPWTMGEVREVPDERGAKILKDHPTAFEKTTKPAAS